MQESLTPTEVIWEQLSEDTKETCLALYVDAFEPEALEFIAQDSEVVLQELRSNGLIEEVTQLQIYEEQAIHISNDRKAAITSPQGLVPPMTDEERTALAAIHSLERYNANPAADQYMMKQKFRFTAEFSRLLRAIDEQQGVIGA